VLVQQYEREGYKNFEPTIFWKRSLLDSSQIEISAPQEQMNRLMAILNTLDPPSTTRTRTIQYATPEEVIPVALNMLVEDYEEQGRIGYRTKTTWERERFDPNVLVFKGPAQEINDLFAILDQLDKPLVKQTRTFYSKTPQEAISEAKDLLVKQYEREGYEDFAPTVFWERDLLDPTKIVISAPQEQMTRLTTILNKVDPPTTMRTRSIVNATPEEVIPSALDIVRQEQVEEGYTDYETRTTWERDRWDPSIIRFEGPPEELSNLFSVLDKLDKPRVTQTRTFYSMEPGEAIPAAMDHLRRQYAEEGRPDYEFSIEWDRDPLQPSQIRIKGPSDEVSRLVAILDQIDKPMQVVKKQIVNEDPQSLIEPALSLLKQHYVENNQPEYEPQAEIRFDKLTGELVLRAPSEELSVLQTILADLDRAQWQDQTITTQKFALGVAPAEDLIQAASDYLAQQVELQGEYGDKPGVVFKVDPITNSIILYGPSTQIAMCMEVMTAMEANSKRGLKPVVIYPKHVSPTQLSSELSTFVSTNIEPSLAPTLQVNDRLGAIFITGTDDVVAKVRDWIRLFDVPKGQNQTQRVVKLKNAEASTLYSVLSQLQILSPDGRMVPETQSNSLLIVDTTETIDRLMPFIEELDVVPPFDNMVYQVIKTRTAQAGYLQTALNQYAQQLASQKGRATRNRATVSYEPYSGSVIVFGLKSDVEQIAKVAAEFDKIELENKKPEFIYLEHADANQTSSTLSRLLSNISPTQSPSLVLPEPRINALIVVAEGEVLEQVKEMVAKIDVESEETQEFRVIPIENVNASQIYSVVYQALMNSYTGSQAPYVTYEPYSNSLIVRAHPDDFETVDKLVEQLDVVSDRQQEVRLVKLKYASAPQVYGVISSLLSALSGGTTAPYVTYLDNSTLVIRAQKDQFSKIDEVVAEFDLPKTAEQEFRVLDVKNISAGAAYNAIYYMLMSDYTGNTQPYVTYSSNQVFVRAHKDDFPKVEELLAEIDVPATQNHEFRAFQVKNIPASQAYSVVYAMLSNDFTGSTGPYVTYAGNQVLVRAHKDDLPKVEKILSEIDVPATQDHEFRAFQVKHIPASQAYSVVYSMLMNDYTGSAAPYMTYGGNQVLVRAHKDDLAKAEKILSEIDISDTENYEFKVIPIKYAVPSQAYYAVYYMLQSNYTGTVAPYVNYTGKNLYVRAHKDDFAKVDKLLSEIDISGMENQEIRVIKIENAPVYPIYLAVSTLLTGSYTGIQEPYVTYDTANNNLIVRAHKDDYPRIQEIVDRLDVSPEADYELKVIPVKGMNAGTLVGNLRPMMIGQNVLFFPDTASNSIIANGRPQDIEKVEEIVDRLGQTGEDATIKLVPLENANYGTLSAALNQYMQVRYGQQPTRPGTYPDSTANAIYIYGASEEVASIEKIVHDLDIPTDSKQEVRIFPIKQAQAATVYTALRSLLFTDYTGGVQPFVTYDNTTNVVIVSAHPEDMVKAEKFIEQIDSTKLDRLEVRMVEVENTPANSIVSALSYLSTSRGRVTADNQTNTVVIVDTPETVEYLASVVKELDVDRKDEETVTEVRNLRYADANYLSNSVINQIAREKMTQSGNRNPEVSAFAEPNSNSLILVGASDEVKYYLGLVDQFDSATTAGGEIVLFQLKHTQ
ncbi:MAG: hypothetical protein KC994_12470, partial [Candidatus Omnitrophica bacterium]|nr:hypothetical protein [Candidatus Omnitrophota bacterium]